jgi:hypothetical protein
MTANRNQPSSPFEPGRKAAPKSHAALAESFLLQPYRTRSMKRWPRNLKYREDRFSFRTENLRTVFAGSFEIKNQRTA